METITTSPTSQEMLNYFVQLNDTEKQSVVDLLKTFLTSKRNNFSPQSLQDYNNELELADAEIAAGDYITHDEVMRKYFAQ
jgi:hypothetical protein